MTPPEIPIPARILQLATASWLSAAVSAAATLGVADALAAGPRPVDDIAKEIDAHAPTLYRLLRACADFDLFEEQDDRVFALTELGHALRTDSPLSMRGFARWVGDPADRFSWSGLADSVRTGRSAFEQVHGQDVWAYMATHPDTASVFNDAMTSASDQMIKPVVAAYDFSRFGRVVDVGGGHGALLAEILRTNPGVHGVLYDQPEVVAGASHPDVADRLSVVGGSFFESVPPGGDAYLLSNVIHDWDDEKSARILSRVRDAMAPDARVLLAEVVMPGKAEPAATVKLMDLNMLVLCDGKQRTEAEFAELFRSAGLALSRIVPTGFCSVVEAVRA
ncbi:MULTISPECIES: methyltransferase [unclassified Amycolatopsis]|uniref:methyltransferase n=1 Tax=unclassified Amycolatopsis TaxID=2618356 RepID=UPI002874CE76|nr:MULTISPECIES: methyltransferase [unclassified Amycolatopsis]MDS0135824.1 methyltransferase [Amycolatopsis sp. 505]MDS0145575.1 methyltransferase [Amycolatopsis sp. CM201R]